MALINQKGVNVSENFYQCSLVVQEDDDIWMEICSFNIPFKKVLQIQDVYELRKYVERPVYWSPYSILYRDFFKLT